MPLMAQPGALWEYSHSTDVLGRLIEVVSGKKLSEFFKERIFDPLGMKDTSFVVEAANHARIAEPYANDRAIVCIVGIHDPRVGYKSEAGGAGLSGTAIDYARFLQMLLDGGVFEGKRYFSPKTIEYMTSDHLSVANRAGAYAPGEGYGFGLGFAVRERQGGSSLPGGVGDYSWGGAAGTYFLGGSKGAHVCRLHDAVAQASRALSQRGEEHGLRGHDPLSASARRCPGFGSISERCSLTPSF